MWFFKHVNSLCVLKSNGVGLLVSEYELSIILSLNSQWFRQGHLFGLFLWSYDKIVGENIHQTKG